MAGKGEGAGGSNRKIRRATQRAGNNRSRRARQYQHLQYYVDCSGARRILHREMREDDVGGEAEAEAEAERQVTSGGRARDARTQESSWVPSLSSQEDSGIEGTHVARLEWCVPAVLWAFLAVVQ